MNIAKLIKMQSGSLKSFDISIKLVASSPSQTFIFNKYDSGIFSTGEFYRYVQPPIASKSIWSTYNVPDLQWTYISSGDYVYYYAGFPDMNNDPHCAMIYFFDPVGWVLRYIDLNGVDQEQLLGIDTYYGQYGDWNIHQVLV